jgi:hypothetical protein
LYTLGNPHHNIQSLGNEMMPLNVLLSSWSLKPTILNTGFIDITFYILTLIIINWWQIFVGSQTELGATAYLFQMIQKLESFPLFLI